MISGSPWDAAWAALRRYALEEEGFACVLADAMGRTNAMGSEVRPMWAGARLVGRAVTARPSGTELAAVFDAIDLAEPGDVVVVEGPGAASVAFWGENTSLSARNRGAVGAVIGAPCRDVAAHARSASPSSPPARRRGPACSAPAARPRCRSRSVGWWCGPATRCWATRTGWWWCRSSGWWRSWPRCPRRWPRTAPSSPRWPRAEPSARTGGRTADDGGANRRRLARGQGGDRHRGCERHRPRHRAALRPRGGGGRRGRRRRGGSGDARGRDRGPRRSSARAADGRRPRGRRGRPRGRDGGGLRWARHDLQQRRRRAAGDAVARAERGDCSTG
jgi:hypothetical protein